MALKLEVDEIDSKTLADHLRELLNNPKYWEAAQFRSKTFQDQKETPLERALWWIDFVDRNPEVSFLKNPKLFQINYFTKHSIDVVAFITILVTLSVTFVIKTILVLIAFVLRRKVDQKVKRH